MNPEGGAWPWDYPPGNATLYQGIFLLVFYAAARQLTMVLLGALRCSRSVLTAMPISLAAARRDISPKKQSSTASLWRLVRAFSASPMSHCSSLRFGCIIVAANLAGSIVLRSTSRRAARMAARIATLKTHARRFLISQILVPLINGIATSYRVMTAWSMAFS